MDSITVHVMILIFLVLIDLVRINCTYFLSLCVMFLRLIYSVLARFFATSIYHHKTPRVAACKLVCKHTCSANNGHPCYDQL